MEVWRPQASCWHAGGSVGCVDLAGLLGTRQATLSPLPCSCRNTLLPSLCRLLNACGRVRTRANRLQTIFSSISLRALSMRGFFHALLSFAFSACGADRRFETALAIICVSRMLSARMPIRATHTIIVCGASYSRHGPVPGVARRHNPITHVCRACATGALQGSTMLACMGPINLVGTIAI